MQIEILKRAISDAISGVSSGHSESSDEKKKKKMNKGEQHLNRGRRVLRGKGEPQRILIIGAGRWLGPDQQKRRNEI